MDEFFCKTRFLWAITRCFFSLFLFWSVYSTVKQYPEELGSVINFLTLVYAACLFVIAVNELREKESDRLFLGLIGASSIAYAVFLVVVTMGRLKSGLGLFLFFVFVWLIIVGIKDLLGNHFFVEE